MASDRLPAHAATNTLRYACSSVSIEGPGGAHVAETAVPMFGVLPALLQLWREHPASELDAPSPFVIVEDERLRQDAVAETDHRKP